MSKKTNNEGQAPKAGASQGHAETAGDAAGRYDAELREWSFRDHLGSTVAFGRVYSDRKGRWPAGFAISTSAIIDDGNRQEGSIVRTLNTRYLLSGPPGNAEAMLALAQHQLANAQRRRAVEQDERLFDLLPAAWGMDDETFEKVAGLPLRWLSQWRDHYRAPTDDELASIQRLMSFHQAIRLVTCGEPNYAEWWRRRWAEGSFIGERSPLEAILSDAGLMDHFERYLRSRF
ncbi:hypothetical protein M8312_13385 [Sphingomonas sp. KRR8]|uniref:hypothetical protein n=1 Tax=Sphingomonas sp. KRR8 TaxID=2942996 RepID=UPI002021398E|nr:hypothetical protein [Sphingomonas sp. KRR8]URD60750.1 hypothetical protein M8312_13385 [Sphingomonas sp. KRR8]